MPRRNLKDDGKGRPGSRPSMPTDRAREPPVTQEWMAATGQAVYPTEHPYETLDRINEPGYGRYSVNRDSNGTAYHKFRWSGGKLAGRYVMFVTDHAEPLRVGLEGLLSKIYGAEEGRVYATLDKYK